MSITVVVVCFFLSVAESAPSESTAESLRAEPLRAESLRAESLRAESLRAESLRAESPSYSNIAANDFSNNLAMINQNIYSGVTGLSNPLFKFAVDTAPNLIHLYAIFNGVNVPPFLASLAKNLYGNAAVAGGKLVGDAAVLASTMMGAGMKVGGHGIQAGSNVLEAAGKSGINLAGKIGDYTASGITVGSDILASGLKTAGDGMLAGAAGANVVSQGISGVIDALGGRLVSAITSAEQAAAQLMDSGVKKLEDGALQFSDKTQEKLYQGLVAYVQILSHLQNLINQFASVVSGVASLNSVASTPSGANHSVSSDSVSAAT